MSTLRLFVLKAKDNNNRLFSGIRKHFEMYPVASALPHQPFIWRAFLYVSFGPTSRVALPAWNVTPPPSRLHASIYPQMFLLTQFIPPQTNAEIRLVRMPSLEIVNDATL